MLVQIVVSNPNSIADVSFRNIISNVFVPIAVLTLCLTDGDNDNNDSDDNDSIAYDDDDGTNSLW